MRQKRDNKYPLGIVLCLRLFLASNVPKFLSRTGRFCFSSFLMALRIVFRILLENAFERPCSLDMTSPMFTLL